MDDERTRRIAGRVSARSTNLTLLGVLALVFATGLGAVMTGSARGRWVVIAHGIAAIAVIVLIPWKAVVIRRGLRRRRLSRFASLALVLLVVLALGLGLLHTTGAVRSVGGFGVLWLHIAVALVLVPLLLVHLVTRPVRWRAVRRSPAREPAQSVPRRAVLRLGGVVGVAAAAYGVMEVSLRLTGAPGAQRRFTGSHEIASSDPAAMPVTSWLDDRTPTVDIGAWRLVVVDGAGRRELRVADLARDPVRVRAILDCTSGWYAEHEWSGVPIAALVTPSAGDRSIYVHSVTGYWARFPLADLGTLLLATGVGGRQLGPGHGYPLRLVAPNRRGFWWVKWVDRIELDSTPSWWHPPLPLT